MDIQSSDYLKSHQLRLKAKIWLEDEQGQTIIGFGLLLALEAIERTGSMNAAAKEMKMGYRSLWGKIKKTEDRIGRPLLSKQVGGASGGHSDLTPFAHELIEKFKKMKRLVEESSDQIFHDVIDKA